MTMASLDLSESRAQELEKLEGTAVNIMQQYLDGKRAGSDEIKFAMQSLNVVAKNRQTTTARDAMRFNMVSALTDDPKVLKRYVKATQPEIKKLLPEG